MQSVYYGWIIVGIGVLAKMAGLGFGRFAYPMLIPSMRESLGFNYVQMGFLSGGILLGYLLFSFIGGLLVTRFGSKRIVILFLFCGSVSMFLISRLSGFLFLLFFCFAMGGAGGGTHISMTTLPMGWFPKEKLGLALGIVTGGTGLGIIVPGLLLPYLLSTLGEEAWRQCWVVLAVITFLVILLGFGLLKERPDRVHPHPFSPPLEEQPITPSVRKDALSFRSILIIYFIFGFAYNIYATYFVAFTVDELQISGKVAGIVWAIFGWMCLVSGLIWGFLSDRLGRRKALLWDNGLISLAVLIPLFFHHPFFLGLSTFLFGSTFLGTVTVIAACIGDQGSEKKASIYGLVTLIHGIGQFLGTTLGGYFKDLTGSFQLTLISSLIGFILCVILTLLSRKE